MCELNERDFPPHSFQTWPVPAFFDIIVVKPPDNTLTSSMTGFKLGGVFFFFTVLFQTFEWVQDSVSKLVAESDQLCNKLLSINLQ